MGAQIVFAPVLKLFEKLWAPVGAIVFETVAEDRVGRIVAERREQFVTDGMEMIFDCGAILVVQHESLRPDGRAFDGHAGTA